MVCRSSTRLFLVVKSFKWGFPVREKTDGDSEDKTELCLNMKEVCLRNWNNGCVVRFGCEIKPSGVSQQPPVPNLQLRPTLGDKSETWRTRRTDRELLFLERTLAFPWAFTQPRFRLRTASPMRRMWRLRHRHAALNMAAVYSSKCWNSVWKICSVPLTPRVSLPSGGSKHFLLSYCPGPSSLSGVLTSIKKQEGRGTGQPGRYGNVFNAHDTFWSFSRIYRLHSGPDRLPSPSCRWLFQKLNITLKNVQVTFSETF